MTASTNQIDLAALGLSTEKITTLVVDRLVERLMHGTGYDPDSGADFEIPTDFSKRISSAVQKAIDAKVEQLADRFVIPKVGELIENWKLQATSSWGEPKGEAISFTEYLVQRAEKWVTETVNYDGKSQAELRSSGYTFNGSQSRLAWMIDKHLQYHISGAMQKALATVTESLGKSISDTVRIQLDEAAQKLKVTVATK